MSPEQRAAAAERLAKAREKRLKENPPKNLSIHPSVRILPDTDKLSLKNVRKWINAQKEIRSSWHKKARKNEKGAEAQYLKADTYIKNMENYLRTGEWLDMFYGEHQEYKIKYNCVKLAYHHNGKFKGQVKRSQGVYYRDLGYRWTKEMDEEYYK